MLFARSCLKLSPSGRARAQSIRFTSKTAMHFWKPCFRAASLSYACTLSAAWVSEQPRNTHYRSYSTSGSHSRLLSSASSGSDQVDASFATEYHAPVMWRECIDALLSCQRSQQRIDDSDDSTSLIFVDGTLGGGGHSAALLTELRPGDVVFGCDVDPTALQTASERLSNYLGEDAQLPLFVPVRSNFCDLISALSEVRHPKTDKLIVTDGVDGILMDLGVSSHQIDTADRGFAFMKEGPLDMRMGQDTRGSMTAADICNEFDAKEIKRILKVYGDEPRARSIAESIVEKRPLVLTSDLVDAVAAVTPQFAKKGKRMGRTSTLARVFQSLRIVVNQEDAVLEKALTQMCPMLLRPGGQLVVLSYHSMEDRCTKRVMRDGTVTRNSRNDERDMYGNYIGTPKPFRTMGKLVKASEEEVELNPRARSATLRVAERQ